MIPIKIVEIRNSRKASEELFYEFQSIDGAIVWISNGCVIIAVNLDTQYYLMTEEPKGFYHLKVLDVKA